MITFLFKILAWPVNLFQFCSKKSDTIKKGSEFIWERENLFLFLSIPLCVISYLGIVMLTLAVLGDLGAGGGLYWRPWIFILSYIFFNGFFIIHFYILNVYYSNYY
tara:strand:+ start:124 stop:441 length:318 start_codon:yes stop_codon:yes gene_type:complete